MAARRKAPALALVLTAAWVGCSDDGGPEPPFPEDYATAYTEVRDCRRSGDHDLHYIRVWADDAALAAYMGRDQPFPDGAVVLKEEFDFADGTCAGPIEQWTVMVRQPEGSATEAFDWSWLRVDRDRRLVGEDEPRCFGCHQACLEPPGYLATCADP